MSFHYPPVKKELFSWQIPKSQLETMKSTILNEGCKRISRDNYPYESAIDTQYAKEISTPLIKSRVQIILGFKETDIAIGYYMNFGINIFNLDRNDIPEVNAEVNRIEGILYDKLLEIAGKENVVRGKR